MTRPNQENIAKDNIITAHRGASGQAPENTISAIRKALIFEVKRIEIDVHQTKDNKVILMHDDTIDRTTNGKGKIKNKLYSELMNLDAGSWFSTEYSNEKIPLLEEAIKVINGNAGLLIHLKYGNNYYPNIIENTVEIIKNSNALEWCILQAFDCSDLIQINKICPKIKIHKLIFWQLPVLPLIIDNGLRFYNYDKFQFITEYSFYHRFINKRLVKKLKKHGKKINAWTVNNRKTFLKLKRIGIDNIITDYPEFM